ncbi:MAG: hypothetical protein ABJE95_03395 [Byssovorax sp.]
MSAGGSIGGETTLRAVPPAPTVLLRLAEKYRTLGALRRARAAGGEVPVRAVFKALAEEFPGCLNELDTLQIEEIDARAEALASAASGGPIEAWMIWLAGYHALLRAALRIRIRTTKSRDLDAARSRDLAADASAHSGAAIDPAFVQAVLRPPGGRIIPVVYARLAALHGAPAATIKRALFPRSRDER